MNDFELNKPDYFEFEAVELIENFEPDDYGNRWYNAKVSGNAESLMWLAKNKPETNKKYYGHIEETKSGKRLRFKTDKLPENAPKGYKSPEQEESIARAVALKAAVEYIGEQEGTTRVPMILDIADTFLLWLKGEKPSTEAPEQPDKQPSNIPKVEDKIIADDGEQINLADIPF